MSGRRRLRSGLTVWLPDHRGLDGRLFARYTVAGLELVGVASLNGSELLRVEVRRYAIAGVVYEQAARAWATAVARRATGRGRKPSGREVERAARRLGLASGDLDAATARLREQAGSTGPRHVPTPAELMAGLREAPRAR